MDYLLNTFDSKFYIDRLEKNLLIFKPAYMIDNINNVTDCIDNIIRRNSN